MLIAEFLVLVRKRLRKSILLEGLSRVVVLCCVSMLGFVAIDYYFDLPGFLRFVILLSYVFILFDTLYLRLWRPLHTDMSDEQLIMLLERKVPELDGRAFVAHDQLPLNETEIASIKQILQPQILQRIIPAPHMNQWLATSGSALLLIGIILGVNASLLGTAAHRLLLPFGSGEWMPKTEIEGGIVGSDVVAVDQPFVFGFKRVRGSSYPLEIRWLDQNGVEGHKVYDGFNSTWREVLQLGAGSYTFKVSSGDSKAIICTGTVVERPQLSSIKAQVSAPSYISSAETETFETLDLNVLTGSHINYTIDFVEQAGREIKDVRMLVNGEAVTVTQQSAHSISASLTIHKESTVSLFVADQNGIALKPEPEYVIKTKIDQAPQIQLSGARRSEKVLLQAEIEFRMDARDDYGMSQIGFHARREPKKGEITQSQLSDYRYAEHKTLSTEKHVLAINSIAADGDRLVLHAEAHDANNITGPGIGNSNQIELHVVSEQELRRELQRDIGAARERVQQGRDALMPAFSAEQKIKQHTKQAGSLAQKASEQLKDVVRRWQQNKLPKPEAQALSAAKEVLDNEAQQALRNAKDIAGTRKADASLAKAYRMLSSAVNQSDLPHELASLIEQQKELSKQSKAFVLKYSVKEMDDAAKNSQAALSDRQQELAKQVREWQQKLMDSKDSRHSGAQEFAKKQRPATALSQAAQQLGSKDQRQRAISAQAQATKDLESIYKKMQGAGEESMGEQIGELANRQQELAEQMQAGAQGKPQQKEQRELAELTKRLLEQLQRKQEKNAKEQKAEEHLSAAQEAQKGSQSSMQQGKQQEAQTDSTVAANLLKQAQRALQDEEDQGTQEDDEDQLEILAMLKDMRKEQTDVVSDAINLHKKMTPGKKVNFRQKRQIAAIDAAEKKMLSKLRDEAIPVLEKQKLQIAIWGIKRLDGALLRAHEHLMQPALGERGVSLCKTVLREIDRLIHIMENMPKPNSNQEGDGQEGGDGGGGGGNDAFPRIAEINLLAQSQELILHYTMARYGEELPSKQRELLEIINNLASGAKAGSRARILLERTKRAMDLANNELQKDEFGVATQHNQRLAVSALEQIMREAKRSKGGKPKNNKQNKKDQDNQKSSAKPNQGKASGKPSGGESSSSSSNAQQREALKDVPENVKILVEQRGIDWYLNLTPKVRQILIEMNAPELPAGAQELFQRYMDKLEDVE